MTDNDSCNADDILKTLRNCTRDVHRRLHKHPVTCNLVRRRLTVDEYVTALHALQRYHASIEAHLELYPSDADQHRASNLLTRDYESITGQAENPLPPCPQLEVAPSHDTRLGILYVLEGSRFGAGIIAGNVLRTLGFDADKGASFFGTALDNLSCEWQELIQSLETQCESARHCATAAETTFRQLEAYLWMVFKEHQPSPLEQKLA
ncbi:MAG: biliverdin-producing heme oxygenase [Granulosicoccus sp.]